LIYRHHKAKPRSRLAAHQNKLGSPDQNQLSVQSLSNDGPPLSISQAIQPIFEWSPTTWRLINDQLSGL
jgi:hypothetical protein